MGALLAGSTCIPVSLTRCLHFVCAHRAQLNDMSQNLKQLADDLPLPPIAQSRGKGRKSIFIPLIGQSQKRPQRTETRAIRVHVLLARLEGEDQD